MVLEARVGRVQRRRLRRCSACSRVFFIFGTFDPNFRLIVTKPDNVPIVGLIFLLGLLRLVLASARRC